MDNLPQIRPSEMTRRRSDFPTVIAIDYIDRWCAVTPYHIVSNVHKAKKTWKKLAWLSLVIVGGLCAFLQTLLMTIEYSGEIRWVSSVTYESSDEVGLEWPNISVCNLNNVFKSQLDDMNITEDHYEIAYAMTQKEEAARFYMDYQEENLSVAEDEEKMISEKVKLSTEKMKNLTADISFDEVSAF